MARRFLDDVRTDINTIIVANGNGDIDGPDLNGILIDMVDSTVQSEAAIISADSTLGIVTAPTFTALTTTYDSDVGGDGSFLIPDFAAGEVVTSATAGFSYSIYADVSLEGGLNDRYDFVVLQNGTPMGFVATQTGEGAADPVSVSIMTFILTGGVSDTYQIGVATPDGANTVDILDIQLGVIIHPTDNP